MALWQESMIRLARSKRLAALVNGQPRLSGLAGRFVGGADVAEVLETAEELAAGGIAASLFYLGEYVTDAAVVAETVARLGEVVDGAAARGLDVAISVDPTQIGLMADRACAAENASVLAGRVLAAAGTPRAGHDAMMIDMEDAGVTAFTLGLHRELADAGLPVAVTLQSYLHRSADDLRDLVTRPTWVRLVKGAFAEPATLAARGRAELDSRYRRACAVALSPAARAAGVFPSFGTHDHRAIAEIAVAAEVNGWSRDEYEIEMLYGVRTDLQRVLVRNGHRVRVYLPFGADWFPYSIRRVGESPRNLRFAAAALTRG